jgi:uncharacterized protein (DUF2336 family)
MAGCRHCQANFFVTACLTGFRYAGPCGIPPPSQQEIIPPRGRELTTTLSLIGELEDALKSGASDKRVATLRRVTNLFLDERDKLNDQQIGVFDDVLVHLMQRIESKALVELSTALAPLDDAPVEVIRRLARNDEITVAGPVLSASARLTQDDLVEIAKSKSQGHLFAISGRTSLPEAVTDVLLERGDRQVTHRLAENSGARFSEAGFQSIVKSAEQDGSLAEKLGLRLDIPLQVLRQLLARATDLVRSRLLASASPDKRGQIQEALAGIANDVAREAAGPRSYVESENLVQQLNRFGKLNEKVLADFVAQRRYEEVTSTLALFCSAPVEFIERLLKNVRPEALIVACKAAKLTWPTVSAILKFRHSHHTISDQELDEARVSFLALSQASAQRAFRFMLVQEKAKAS